MLVGPKLSPVGSESTVEPEELEYECYLPYRRSDAGGMAGSEVRYIQAIQYRSVDNNCSRPIALVHYNIRYNFTVNCFCKFCINL